MAPKPKVPKPTAARPQQSNTRQTSRNRGVSQDAAEDEPLPSPTATTMQASASTSAVPLAQTDLQQAEPPMASSNLRSTAEDNMPPSAQASAQLNMPELSGAPHAEQPITSHLPSAHQALSACITQLAGAESNAFIVPASSSPAVAVSGSPAPVAPGQPDSTVAESAAACMQGGNASSEAPAKEPTALITGLQLQTQATSEGAHTSTAPHPFGLAPYASEQLSGDLTDTLNSLRVPEPVKARMDRQPSVSIFRELIPDMIPAQEADCKQAAAAEGPAAADKSCGTALSRGRGTQRPKSPSLPRSSSSRHLPKPVEPTPGSNGQEAASDAVPAPATTAAQSQMETRASETLAAVHSQLMPSHATTTYPPAPGTAAAVEQTASLTSMSSAGPAISASIANVDTTPFAQLASQAAAADSAPVAVDEPQVDITVTRTPAANSATPQVDAASLLAGPAAEAPPIDAPSGPVSLQTADAHSPAPAEALDPAAAAEVAAALVSAALPLSAAFTASPHKAAAQHTADLSSSATAEVLDSAAALAAQTAVAAAAPSATLASPPAPSLLETADRTTPAPNKGLDTATAATRAAAAPPFSAPPASPFMGPACLQSAVLSPSAPGQALNTSADTPVAEAAAVAAVTDTEMVAVGTGEVEVTACAAATEVAAATEAAAGTEVAAAAAAAAAPTSATPVSGLQTRRSAASGNPSLLPSHPQVDKLKRNTKKCVVEESEDEKEEEKQDSMAVDTQGTGQDQTVEPDAAELSVDTQSGKRRKGAERTPARPSARTAAAKGIQKPTSKGKQAPAKSSADVPAAIPLPAPITTEPIPTTATAAAVTATSTAGVPQDQTAAATVNAASCTADDTVVAPGTGSNPGASTATAAAVAVPHLTKAQQKAAAAAALKKEKESKTATVGPVPTSGSKGIVASAPTAALASGSKRNRNPSSKAQEARDAVAPQREASLPTHTAPPSAPSLPIPPTVNNAPTTTVTKDNTSEAAIAASPAVQPSSKASPVTAQTAQPTINATSATAAAPSGQSPMGQTQPASLPGGHASLPGQNASLPVQPSPAGNDLINDVLACLAQYESSSRAMSATLQRLMDADLPPSVKFEYVRNSKGIKDSLYGLAYDADSPHNAFVALVNAFRKRGAASMAEQGPKLPDADTGQQVQKKAKLAQAVTETAAAAPPQKPAPLNAPKPAAAHHSNGVSQNSHSVSNRNVIAPFRAAAPPHPHPTATAAAKATAAPKAAGSNKLHASQYAKLSGNGQSARAPAGPLPKQTAPANPPAPHPSTNVTSPPRPVSSPAAEHSNHSSKNKSGQQQPRSSTTEAAAETANPAACHETKDVPPPTPQTLLVASTGDRTRDHALLMLYEALIGPCKVWPCDLAVSLEKALCSRYLPTSIRSTSHGDHGATSSVAHGAASQPAASTASASAGTINHGLGHTGQAEAMLTEGSGAGLEAYAAGLHRIWVMLSPGELFYRPELGKALRDGKSLPADVIANL